MSLEKRMTYRDPYNNAFIADSQNNIIVTYSSYTGPAVERLAAYEDTGMTPEEIEDCKEKWNKMSMRERLDTIAEPAELFPDRSECGRLDLGLDDCENVADFIENEFFTHMYHLLLAGDLDNVGYVRSLIRAMDALYKAAGKEPLGISYAPEVGG